MLAEWDATPHLLTGPGGASTAAPDAKDSTWFVGLPHMSSPLELEARGIASVRHVQVARAEERPGGWCLFGAGGLPLAEHEELVLALPVARAADVLPEGMLRQALPKALLDADFVKARYASTLAFEAPLRLPYDFGIASYAGAAVTVLIDETARRAAASGRGGAGTSAPATTWIAQTDTKWAAKHLEAATPAAEVGRQIVAEVEQMVGPLPPLAGCVTGCWQYGDADYLLSGGFRRLRAERLTLAGDWAYTGRVEGAWLSGWDAAGALLEGGRNDPSDCF